MNALTIREDMTVDSRTIATGSGIKHINALELLETHRSVIESELGVVRFETEAVKREGERGTKHVKVAYLTEDQATALVTMFRNTPVVVRFKVALAKAFGEAKRGKLPNLSRKELLRLALDQEERLDAGASIIDRLRPTSAYGETARNGFPKTGLRRAAFVAAKNRITEAAELLQLSAQMELTMWEDGK
jgi:phage regulator Rha-like protein